MFGPWFWSSAELCTLLDSFSEDPRQRNVHKPKMEVTLGKSADFDAIMAEQAKAEAAAAAEQPQQPAA